MKSLDETFINKLSSYFRNFRGKSADLYNFSCWYCGDSEKNMKKARGYIYNKKGDAYYHCHNCGKHKSLKNVLKDIDFGLYREYLKGYLTADQQKISKDLLTPEITLENDIFKEYNTIAELDTNHYAKKYCVNRKLPKKWFDQIWFIPDYKDFTNRLIPKKFKNVYPDPRVVVPFYTKNGKIFGYQGRALRETKARYISIILDNAYDKFWNLNNVDFNKKFYVTEGTFDAMFLSNAIAMAGADANVYKLNDNAVFILDNEPRNKEILGKYQKLINLGKNIFIWPDNIPYKDINEAILGGWQPSEIQQNIDQHTYKELKAKLKFKEWKKLS